MAKRQTRRTVSLNRELYKAAMAVAEKRGLSLAHFVDEALRAAGVKAPRAHHTDLEHVRRVRAGIRRSIPEREAKRRAGQIAKALGKLPGPIRQALGDEIADMCGEP